MAAALVLLVALVGAVAGCDPASDGGLGPSGEVLDATSEPDPDVAPTSADAPIVLTDVAEDVVEVGGPGDPGGDVGADPSPVIHLVDHDLWRLTSLADDPFRHVGPDEPRCLEDGWYVEDGFIEVDTWLCNYVTLEQPLAHDLTVGDRVDVIAWHGPLLSPDGHGEAHIAVVIGAHTLWSEDLPIPHWGSFFTPEIDVPFDAPAGTPVRFHVHNHGPNTWTLMRIALRPGAVHPAEPR